ncbi:MAG: magnesium transporter [Actinomycetota bacterium]|jgi:magnesium transporter|nr:magnesium transporter [Actinomycetota bacterium]
MAEARADVTVNDTKTAADDPADGRADRADSRARLAAGQTFAGRDPAAAATAACCAQTPTRCPARARAWRNGKLVAEGFPVAQISDYLAEDDATVVWLDLADPDLADLEVLTEEFGLHPLAVEDAVHEHQRAKLDRYRDHLLLSAYAAHLDTDSGELATSELAAFITPRALITVRKDDGFDVGRLVERWDASPDLAAAGIGFLLHGLLDQIVDGHFSAVQTLDDEIEDLQDSLFSDANPGLEVQRRSFELRKSLVLLRRVVLPMREVVNTLMRRDLHLVDDAMAPYFQDVYDHVLRATEWTESLRDLVTTILETRLTIQGNRLNEIMKKLTAWAAIIAVPTAVTGFYGQNVPYPGFQQPWGFVSSIALIIVIGVGLYVTFRRNDWL